MKTGLRIYELENGRAAITGIAEAADGKCTALTISESATFRSEQEAVEWLRLRGYAPNGERLRPAGTW